MQQRVVVLFERGTDVAGHHGVLEVLTGAEPAAGAGDDEHARCAGLLDPADGVADLLVHRLGECVEAVGAVERQRGHAVGDLK